VPKILTLLENCMHEPLVARSVNQGMEPDCTQSSGLFTALSWWGWEFCSLLL